MNHKIIWSACVLLMTASASALAGDRSCTPALQGVGFAAGNGTAKHPYQIVDADQLNAVRCHLDKSFKLMKSLNLQGRTLAPLSSPGRPFTGKFDGVSKIIYNWTYSAPDEDDVGLFGVVDAQAVVTRVYLRMSTITGRDRVGGIAGSNRGILYKNSVDVDVRGRNSVGLMAGLNQFIPGDGPESDTVATIESASTRGYVEGNSQVGGLVGSNDYRCKVTRASSVARVNGTGSDVGGLIGSNAYHAEVSRSRSNGRVSGDSRVGGLIGFSDGSVTRSYSLAQVWAENDYAGGLIGYNEFHDSVEDSFARGQVTAQNIAGGLIGYNNSRVQRTYSRGQVVAMESDGGLIGMNGEDGIVEDSYWDRELSKQSESAGGTPKTSAEMKKSSTYVGWDFYKVWWMYYDLPAPTLR